jgi:hypothetical protein
VNSSDLYQCTMERLDNPAGRLTAVACCPGEPVGAPVKLGSAVVWLVRDYSFEDPVSAAFVEQQRKGGIVRLRLGRSLRRFVGIQP